MSDFPMTSTGRRATRGRPFRGHGHGISPGRPRPQPASSPVKVTPAQNNSCAGRAASEKPASGVPSPGVPARLDPTVATIDEVSARTSTGTEAELARQLGLVTPQNDQSLTAEVSVPINTTAAVGSAPPPASDSTEGTEPEDGAFGAIIKHRVNHDDSTIREGLGGREQATGLDEYHVFAILDSRGSAGKYRKLLCQWVGYPNEPEQNTWELETKVRSIAETIHDEWLEEMKKKNKGRAKKGTAKSKAKNKI
ncbi:uncharacterized protein B0J16DRAFT_375264 [Fusarium flagelliforme]|uniref:uncharacterized protein n=1 Tax=Fusarium flagelliforme TaxID=2675880 RepID=UPI001E8D455C|nr:uncharacterized protein B0J16DRAFT_375264 [Fusarium flagelliforme]KAH7174397.1 hypothetical protein B0J16DRAFT_375264 [Fusarium flagelliforme]